ncbi:MAG: hypothetical protein AAB475_01970 [Patescibacteria group bacterium]
MNNLQLKKRIMRRVYTVYALHKIVSRAAFKVYLGVVLLFGIKILVHVEAVANNMPEVSDVAGLYNFIMYSVLNTEFSVQLIVFGVAGLVVWVMRDAIKNIFSRGIRQNQIHITY